MFIDTSALVAIIEREAEAVRLKSAIRASEKRWTSPLVRLETTMVLSRGRNSLVSQLAVSFDNVIKSLGVEITPLTDEMGIRAVEAFEKFGKGRGHPAQLNLADCMSYGAAKVLHAQLLFKGDDFAKTDIAVAAF
jgi:ribonuclease VapC